MHEQVTEPISTDRRGTPGGRVSRFGEVADHYLNTRTAVSDYQMMRYRRVVSRLAETFPVLEEIDDQAVATWVRAMLADGKAAKTIANYHALLFAICGYAVRKGLLAHSPCQDTQLPRRSAYDADGEPVACSLELGEFALVPEAMCAASAYEWRPAGGRGKRRAPCEVVATGVGYREDRDLITLAVHTGLRWGRSPRCGSANSSSTPGDCA